MWCGWVAGAQRSALGTRRLSLAYALVSWAGVVAWRFVMWKRVACGYVEAEIGYRLANLLSNQLLPNSVLQAACWCGWLATPVSRLFGKFYLPEVLSNDLLDFSPASQIPPFPPASVAACAEICNGDEDM